MQREPKKTNKKRCSIETIDGEVIVIDHSNGNKIIKPTCGVDAMARYTQLKSSLRAGDGESAAEAFLNEIADGHYPVTRLIQVAREGC